MNERFLLMDTAKMEAEEKVKMLQKRVGEKSNSAESDEAIEKLTKVNSDMMNQLTLMKDALKETREEKVDIMGKTEKEWYFY